MMKWFGVVLAASTMLVACQVDDGPESAAGAVTAEDGAPSDDLHCLFSELPIRCGGQTDELCNERFETDVAAGTVRVVQRGLDDVVLDDRVFDLTRNELFQRERPYSPGVTDDWRWIGWREQGEFERRVMVRMRDGYVEDYSHAGTWVRIGWCSAPDDDPCRGVAPGAHCAADLDGVPASQGEYHCQDDLAVKYVSHAPHCHEFSEEEARTPGD